MILEAGIRFSAIKKAICFDLHKVSGCLISHEHGDHFQSAPEMLHAGIDVYASFGTWNTKEIKHHRAHNIAPMKQFCVGGFTVLPFDVQHDAVEPLGFLIQHQEIGKLLFITDSFYCKYKFQGVDVMMLECNYSKKILEENIAKGNVPNFLKERITRSHFELENLKDFLRHSDLSKTRNIVLIHLSGNNSDAEGFKKEIECMTGIMTQVAYKNLEIDIGKSLF